MSQKEADSVHESDAHQHEDPAKGIWLGREGSKNANSHGSAVWFLVGNRGMDYGDYIWGLYSDNYRDPFPHSLLSTRHSTCRSGGVRSTVFGVLRCRR